MTTSASPTSPHTVTETIDPKTGDRLVQLAPGLPVLVFPADGPRTFAEMTPEQLAEADRLCLALLDVLNAEDEA